MLFGKINNFASVLTSKHYYHYEKETNNSAPIGVIFLGECGAATGSAVGGGIGSTIGTIIGYYTGKNIGTAIYDLFQEYLDIITH